MTRLLTALRKLATHRAATWLLRLDACDTRWADAINDPKDTDR